jgi:Rieske Fe-S protein
MTTCSRRHATRRLLEAAAVAYGAGLAARCAPGGGKPPVLASVPLAEVLAGGHLTLAVGEHSVDLSHRDGEVVARLLVCTHMGCRLTWREAQARYTCPCHEGAFDAGGRPVAGPPLAPLLDAPFAIEGASVVFRAPASP